MPHPHQRIIQPPLSIQRPFISTTLSPYPSINFSIHPLTGKERRLNLIVYMNPSWKEEYGGHLQFLDENMANCTQL